VSGLLSDVPTANSTSSRNPSPSVSGDKLGVNGPRLNSVRWPVGFVRPTLCAIRPLTGSNVTTSTSRSGGKKEKLARPFRCLLLNALAPAA
jgi:hypothetical protein